MTIPGSTENAGSPVVREFSADRTQAWDEYVAQQPKATLFHGIAWKKSVERAFGFRSHYLVAERANSICGILPLFYVSNPLGGRALISTPFAVYGGVCADDEAAQHALLDRAYSLAREKRVKYLELRNREALSDSDLQTKRLYVMFECDIDLAEDKLMASFPHEPKTKIRKGIKAGLTSVVGHEHLDDFYSVYAESMHNLGSPIFSKRWCQILIEELGDAVQILIIKNGDRPCASTFAYKYRDWILPTYGGSTVWARKLAANNFMYWEIMRHARAAGIRHFDFGRCKLGTGVYSFKSHWGMREHALPYQYLLPDNAKLPDLSPANKNFHLAIEVWKRLPLGVTKAVGPLLAPFFP